MEHMSTETQGGETPAVEPGAKTESVTISDAAPETIVEPQDDKTEKDTSDDESRTVQRLQRRIGKRTADYYREKGENDQLRARIAQLETPKSEDTAPKAVDPVALAREISRVDRFTEKANELVDLGNKAHADYMPVLKDLAEEVGAFVQPNGMPSPFMSVVLEVSDRPQELLYHLGKNPEIAETLAGLNQIQLTKKLDRIEREMTDSSKSKTNDAPKPLEPVKGRSSSTLLEPGLSTAEWMRRREAQVKASKGR